MDPEIIAHIRSRVERCRRLAATISDRRAVETLLQMAEEGEADLARLEAERAGLDAQERPHIPVIRIV